MTLSDIFISYSRKDTVFVKHLSNHLQKLYNEIWVDWEDIPPSAEWWAAITKAIEGANIVIAVISPAAVSSNICLQEIDLACSYNKKIIPVVLEKVADSSIPAGLAKLNWIFFNQQDDFTHSLNLLVQAVNTDLNWVRFHTRLLVKANEWKEKGFDESYQLYNKDLEEAQTLIKNAGAKAPVLSELQHQYIVASQLGKLKIQQRQLKGFYVVSIVYGLAQAVVTYFVTFDEISETGLVRLSPLWVIAIVFGVTGLTFAKNSIKTSIAVAIIAAILLLIFFEAIFPSL